MFSFPSLEDTLIYMHILMKHPVCYVYGFSDDDYLMHYYR